MKQWVTKHPAILSWIVLALGMNAILLYQARNVGLVLSQWFWLILITTLVAGLCIWIISWGDDENEEEKAS